MIEVKSEVPARIKKLPVDSTGNPVPWFVAWIHGVPDFGVIGEDKVREAIRFKRCWTCGETLGTKVCFVLNPEGVVEKTTIEPPMHRDCSVYAAQNLYEGPRVVWTTTGYTLSIETTGVLFCLGEPHEVWWFGDGRKLTRAEASRALEIAIYTKPHRNAEINLNEAEKWLPKIPVVEVLAALASEAPQAAAAEAPQEKPALPPPAEEGPREYLFRCARPSGTAELRVKVIVDAVSKSAAKEIMRQVLHKDWRWIEILAVKK